MFYGLETAEIHSRRTLASTFHHGALPTQPLFGGVAFY